MIVPTLRLGLGLRFPGPGPSFASTAVAVVLAAPAFQASFTGLSSLPSWMSFSRASNAMVTDSTGNLTYAPNNLLTQSNTFTDAAWTKDQTGTISATGIADPFGGTAASTFTAGASGGRLYQNAIFTLTNTTNGLSTVWLRRRTGTGSVSMYNSSAGGVPITITGTWAQYTLVVAGLTANGYAGIQLNVSGDAVDIYAPTLSAVTYETSPRSVDQVITGASAYYGPRSDFAWNGSAWVAVGLLIEEQRTNLLFYSGTFDTFVWTYSGVTATANATVSPDGTVNATKFTEAATTAEHRLYLNATGTSATATAWTLYAKKAERNWVAIRNGGGTVAANFDVNAGVVGTTGGTNFISASIIPIGNGWYRCIMIATAGAGGDFMTINLGNADTGVGTGYTYTGDGTSGLYLWGGGIEPGSFPTSYIPTTTAAATRSADIAQLTGAAAAQLATQPYSLIAEGQVIQGAATNYNAFLMDATSAQWLSVLGSTNNTVTSYSAVNHNAVLGSGDVYSPFRGAVAGDGASLSVVGNGGSVTTDATHGIKTTGTPYVGSDGTGQYALNGWLRSIAIYPSRLSDTDLQAKSVVGASF